MRTWGLLVKQNELEVYRIHKGDYDRTTGKYIEGKVERLKVRGSYPQRVKQNMLIQLPEALKSRETIRVFSHDPLRMAKEGSDGYESDVIIYDEMEWEIVRCYPRLTGHLDHYDVIAARKTLAPDKRIQEVRRLYLEQNK